MTTPLVEHAEALGSINADQDIVIANDIGGLFAGSAHPDFHDIARQAVPQIIGQHAGASGLITSQWYDELDPHSSFRAKPYSDVDIGVIEKTVNWALFAPGDEPAQSRLTTASQRMVRNVSRDTVIRNAQEEGVLWARYASATACSFCRILASRGIGRTDRKGLYASEHIAIFQGPKGVHPGEKYHRHCVPAGTLVSGPRTEAAYRRLYEGEAVVIHTASGQKLTVTPNHPVLTDQGWVPAGSLQYGDNTVRSRFGDAGAAAVPHEHQQPALIEDVWGALAVSMFARVPVAAEDFHGDGRNGEVDVVWADGSLGARRESSLMQVGCQLGFARRHTGRIGFAAPGSITALLKGSLGPAHRVMGRGRQLGALIGTCPAHADLASLLDAAAFDAQFEQSALNHQTRDVKSIGYLQLGELFSDVQVMDHVGVDVESVGSRFDPTAPEFVADDRGAYARLGRDLLGRLSGQVELDSVIQLERVSFADDVFNLQTTQGWYSANGIIVSNCRCIATPIRAGQVWDPPEYVLEWNDEYGKAVKALKERGVTPNDAPKKGAPGYDRDWWLKKVVAELDSREAETKKKAETAKRLAPRQEKLNVDLDAAIHLREVEEAAHMAGIRANFSITEENARGAINSAKQVVRAAEDVHTEFPTVKIASIGDGIHDSNSYAWTNCIGRESYIAINRIWLEDSAAWKGSWSSTVEHGYHYAGTGDPAYDATIHELGHAVHNAANFDGKKVDFYKVNRALSDYYVDNYKGIDPRTDYPAFYAAFQDWQKANMSGYSDESLSETVAEAFADAFINRDDAHETSKVIYRVLVDALHGRDYVKPNDWGFNPPSKPPQVMNYKGPVAVPAVVATGPQNTALMEILAAFHGQWGEQVPTDPQALADSLAMVLKQ